MTWGAWGCWYPQTCALAGAEVPQGISQGKEHLHGGFGEGREEEEERWRKGDGEKGIGGKGGRVKGRKRKGRGRRREGGKREGGKGRSGEQTGEGRRTAQLPSLRLAQDLEQLFPDLVAFSEPTQPVPPFLIHTCAHGHPPSQFTAGFAMPSLAAFSQGSHGDGHKATKSQNLLMQEKKDAGSCSGFGRDALAGGLD